MIVLAAVYSVLNGMMTVNLDRNCPVVISQPFTARIAEMITFRVVSPHRTIKFLFSWLCILIQVNA